MSALGPADEARLLSIARRSLAHGLSHGCALAVTCAQESPVLRESGASFVTLHGADDALRGCIGTLEALRPLVQDVAENAFGAGFRDPRFAPVAADEVPHLHLSVSVLGPYEAIATDSPGALARQLRPGRDGLVLQQGARRATFLPTVWGSLADPIDFVRALEHKAGIASWGTPVEAWRYETITIEDRRSAPVR